MYLWNSYYNYLKMLYHANLGSGGLKIAFLLAVFHGGLRAFIIRARATLSLPGGGNLLNQVRFGRFGFQLWATRLSTLGGLGFRYQ